MAAFPQTQTPRVLSVCSDPLLRRTRQLVLSLRYVCISVGGVEEVARLADEEFHVVVLCHSLAREQCEKAIATALQLWRAAHILVLSSADASYCRGAEAVVRTGSGPEYLLDSVERLLQSNRATPFSQEWKLAPQAFGRAAGGA